MSYKQYIGDAVYVEHDGYHIVLTTENGYQTTNRICLEPSVMEALRVWYMRLQEELNERHQAEPI